MPRKGPAPKRPVIIDPVYGSPLVTPLINKVLLNGKHLFDAEDATFAGAGRVGLWTKADSVVMFDDFSHGTN